MNSIRELLRAMLHIGDAAGRVATATHAKVIRDDDAVRLERIGDIAGQTARAQAFAAELDARVGAIRA
jgi:hypothetical protein